MRIRNLQMLKHVADIHAESNPTGLPLLGERLQLLRRSNETAPPEVFPDGTIIEAIPSKPDFEQRYGPFARTGRSINSE